jgi:hypothetical protein
MGSRVASFVWRYAHYEWPDHIIKKLIWLAHNATLSSNSRVYRRSWLTLEDYNSPYWPDRDSNEMVGGDYYQRGLATERGKALFAFSRLIKENSDKYSYLHQVIKDVNNTQSHLDLMKAVCEKLLSELSE